MPTLNGTFTERLYACNSSLLSNMGITFLNPLFNNLAMREV